VQDPQKAFEELTKEFGKDDAKKELMKVAKKETTRLAKKYNITEAEVVLLLKDRRERMETKDQRENSSQNTKKE